MTLQCLERLDYGSLQIAPGDLLPQSQYSLFLVLIEMLTNKAHSH